MSGIPGIDLSGNNVVSSFHDVAGAGKKWLYTKATEGDSVIDDTCADYCKRAASVGLYVTAYHFVGMQSAATDQAHYFIAQAKTAFEQVEDKNLIIRPVLDMEKDSQGVFFGWNPNDASTRGPAAKRLVAYLDAFLPIVQGALCNGAPMIVYSYFDLLKNFPELQALSNPFIVAAYYGTDESPPPDPTDGITCDVVGWQYTSTGSVKGVAGNVDLDLFYKPLDDYRIYPSESV